MGEGWAQGLLNRCCDVPFSTFLLLRLEVDVFVSREEGMYDMGGAALVARRSGFVSSAPADE